MATLKELPIDREMVALLRGWIRGERKPWIYDASVYDEDPVALTAKYQPATSEKGARAWYFVSTTRKKEGNDERMSRQAGDGTWKEERTRAVSIPISGGAHEDIGWRQTLSFVIKPAKRDKPAKRGKPAKKDLHVCRVGWIMLAVGLPGDKERFICKIYPTPRPKSLINPLIPMLAVLAPTAAPVASVSQVLGSADVAVSSSSEAPYKPVLSETAAQALGSADVAESSSSEAPYKPVLSETAAPVASVAQALSSADVAESSSSEAPYKPVLSETAAPVASAAQALGSADVAVSSSSEAPYKPVLSETAVPVASAAQALVSADVAVLFSSEATYKPVLSETAADTAPASPPKRWVSVQISGSPTKSMDIASAKRVFSILLPDEEEDVSHSSKKMKLMDCKGWLTIEPMSGNVQLV